MPNRTTSTALLVLILMPALPLGCQTESRRVSGRIEARRTLVAAEMSGRVVEIAVREGDRVSEGDLLLALDCDAPTARLRQAEAQRDQASARLALLLDGARPEELAVAEADVTVAEQRLRMARRGATAEQLLQLESALAAVEAQLELAQHALARAERLLSTGSTTGASADEANAQVNVLTAERARLQAQLSEAQRGARREERRVVEQRLEQAGQRLALLESGARAPELEMARAQLQAAEAGVALAAVGVDRCRLLAPVSGTVDVVDFEQGELATAGSVLLALNASRALRVRTFAPQTTLGGIEVGDRLAVFVDGFEEVGPIEGLVLRIYDDPEFASGNVQTPEDRMLLVYRVELELPDESPIALRPGMTVTVDLTGPVEP